jgi:tetratricopeptide (TPR) repeat protein
VPDVTRCPEPILRAFRLAAALTAVACIQPGGSTGGPGPAAESAPDIGIALAEELRTANEHVSAAWVVYALGLSSIQASRKGESFNQRDADFVGELKARAVMAEYWEEARVKGAPADPYLDALLATSKAGHLDEYTLFHLFQPGWTLPAAALSELDLAGFRVWSEVNLHNHEPQTLAAATRTTANPDEDAPLPGTDLVLPEGGDPCARAADVQTSLTAWTALEPRLDGAPISASDRLEFIASITAPDAPAEMRTRGATWVAPTVADAYYLVGFCAVAAGNWSSALAPLRSAVRVAPHAPMIRLELATVLTHDREHRAAEHEIQAVLDMTDDPCMRGAAWRKRGFLQFEAGELEAAYDAYAQSLRFAPASDTARSEMLLIRQQLSQLGREVPADYVPPPTAAMNVIQCTAPAR